MWRLMRTKREFFRCIVLGTSIVTINLTSARTFAEQSDRPGASDQQQVNVTPPKSVTLPVRVRDKGGRLVRDLKEEEFRIFENGKEQKTTSFSLGKPRPLALGLLMQVSGQRRDTLTYGEVDPAIQFFRSILGKENSSFAAQFSWTVEPLAEFTDDSS